MISMRNTVSSVKSRVQSDDALRQNNAYRYLLVNYYHIITVTTLSDLIKEELNATEHTVKKITVEKLSISNYTGKVILGKSGSPQGFLCCAAVGASFVIG